MSLTLSVDGERWRQHLRQVADDNPGLAPVAKVLNDVGEAVSGAAGKVFSKFGGGNRDDNNDTNDNDSNGNGKQ